MPYAAYHRTKKDIVNLVKTDPEFFSVRPVGRIGHAFDLPTLVASITPNDSATNVNGVCCTLCGNFLANAQYWTASRT